MHGLHCGKLGEGFSHLLRDDSGDLGPPAGGQQRHRHLTIRDAHLLHEPVSPDAVAKSREVHLVEALLNLVFEGHGGPQQ